MSDEKERREKEGSERALKYFGELLGRDLMEQKLERREYAGGLRPDSDLARMLERPHREYAAAPGRDDYLCEHCESEMQVREIEFEGSTQEFVSGSRGDEPVISHKMALTIYVSHRCVRAHETDCLGVELSYEI